jgi:hypothetical protein
VDSPDPRPADPKLIEALQEVSSEIRAFRYMLFSVIAPALRDEDGRKTREGFLRMEGKQT